MNIASPEQPETVDTLLQAAQAQLAAGQLQAAEKLLQRALTLDPNNPVVLDGGAQIALRLGKIIEAESLARRAAQARPAVAFVLTLADVLKAKGDFDDATKYFLLVHNQLPQELRTLISLAEICEQTGYRSRAIHYYELALRVAPTNTSLFRQYSKLMPFLESPRVLAALLKTRPPESASIAARLEFQSNLVMWTECAERATNGVPSYARTAADLFFSFARNERDTFERCIDDAMNVEPSNSYAVLAKATCLLARGERREAGKFFRLRAKMQPDSIYANVVFEDDFFLRLRNKSDTDLLKGLPPLIDVHSPDFEDAPIIFLSCDHTYYLNYARPLLVSMNDVSQSAQVHLHIMDASDSDLNATKLFCAKLTNTTIAISAERPEVSAKGLTAARCYYHAIRFIRMYQCLKRYQKPLWLMDVDGLVHRDPRPVFESAKDVDIALFGHPGRWEPWMQFNASMMGIHPTAQGTLFLKLVAAYISEFYTQNALHWGIDQLAMFSVHEFLKEQDPKFSVHMLTAQVVDGHCRDDAFVWTAGGGAKFSKFKPTAASAEDAPDSPRVRYLEKLNKYAPHVC